MPIRLIAIDLYGTLLGPGGHGIMPLENLEAISTALGRGIKIALVTGLNHGSAINILRKSGIEPHTGLMVACYNGAVMFETATGDVVWEFSLSADLGRLLVEHHGIKPHFPMVHGPFGPRNLMWIQDGTHPRIISQYLESRVELLGFSSVRIVDKLAESMDFPIQDISFLALDNVIHHTEELLNHQFTNEVKLIKSSWKDGYTWLEILRPEAGKGEAVKRMCQRFDLKAQEVMAIGDNWNDIEMLKQAGVSVAMGNAPEDVKQQATHVTLHWEQAGVAHAVNNWALTK